MPNGDDKIKTIVNDPDFQGLSLGEQQKFLSRVDPDFSNLKTGEFSTFLARYKGQQQPAVPGAPYGLPPMPGSPTSPGGPMQPPSINMQPSNLGIAAGLGGAPPLMSMQPGLPAPAQVPENLRAMQTGSLIGGAVANPVATTGAVLGGLIGGQGAKKGAQALGGGETAQRLAQLGGGLVGGVLGGGTGAAMETGLKRTIAGKVWMQQPDGTWEADPWAEALTFGTKLGKAVLNHLAPKPATDLAMADAYAAQRGVQQAAARNALVADKPLGPGQFEPQPTVPPELLSKGPQADKYAAVRAAQRAAARQALKQPPAPPSNPFGEATSSARVTMSQPNTSALPAPTNAQDALFNKLFGQEYAQARELAQWETGSPEGKPTPFQPQQAQIVSKFESPEAQAVKAARKQALIDKQAALEASHQEKRLKATVYRKPFGPEEQEIPEAPKPQAISPFAGMQGTSPSEVSGLPQGKLPQVAPPISQPQIEMVSKFEQPKAEPSRIVTPESTPPPQKVTYQSYQRKDLYEMAKHGDIQAGLELIRNPKGFELPPNFKYLIEESAKHMPWRNLKE